MPGWHVGPWRQRGGLLPVPASLGRDEQRSERLRGVRPERHHQAVSGRAAGRLIRRVALYLSGGARFGASMCVDIATLRKRFVDLRVTLVLMCIWLACVVYTASL